MATQVSRRQGAKGGGFKAAKAANTAKTAKWGWGVCLAMLAAFRDFKATVLTVGWPLCASNRDLRRSHPATSRSQSALYRFRYAVPSATSGYALPISIRV